MHIKKYKLQLWTHLEKEIRVRREWEFESLHMFPPLPARDFVLGFWYMVTASETI